MPVRNIFCLASAFIVLLLSYFSCSNSTKGNEENVYLEVARDTNFIIVKEHKMLILPFDYVSYTNGKIKYVNTKVVSTMMFNSFYSLFSLVPSIDLPEKQELDTIIMQNPAETAAAEKADFIVYGNYAFSGKRSNPDADINLIIWSRITKSEITNVFKVPTDEDIFEGIDGMTGYIVKSILKEDKKLAFLKFGNFNIPPEEYELYVNDRLVANPSNRDFSLELKILSKTKYHVLMKRVSDGAEVIDTGVQLDAGESSNISFDTNKKLITDYAFVGRNYDSWRNVEIYYDIDLGGFAASITTNFSYGPHKPTAIPEFPDKSFDSCFILSVSLRGGGFAGINFARDQGNWKGYDSLSIWAAGNLSRKGFNIIITDAYNQRWIYVVEDYWKGWKRITIPFCKLRRRRDNQPPNAVLNGILNFPIKTLEFFNVDTLRGGRLGTYEMYYGPIEVYR